MNYKNAMQLKKEQKEAARRFLLKLDIQHFAEGEGGDKGGDGGQGQKSVNELLADIQATTQTFAQKLNTMETEMKEKGQVTDSTKNSVDGFEKKLNSLTEDLKKMQRPDYQGQFPELKSAGQQFIESDQYKRMIDNKEQKSAPVKVDFSRKDLTTGAASAGALITPDRRPGILSPVDRQFFLRDALAVANTGSNSIEFVRETGFVNNARPVAEGNLKPQSDLTFTPDQAPVRTIAHWMAATRQVIADAGQLQAYIDNRLRYGLMLEEERQILYGDGTGENLSGIMTDAAIQDAGAVGSFNPADNVVDHLRRSMTRVMLAGYPATAAVLHPLNWEEIELMKADTGQYLWMNLGDQINPRLFRIPVINTPAINQNEFLMGAFGLGAQLWDREETEVRIGEPNDYFIRNMIAILAEERIGLTKFRPEAFISGTLTPAAAATV